MDNEEIIPRFCHFAVLVFCADGLYGMTTKICLLDPVLKFVVRQTV